MPPGDSDCDSWTNSQEGGIGSLDPATLGTDPNDDCPDNTSDDAYPADFDKNRIVNVFDILTGLGPQVGKTSLDPGWVPTGKRANLDTPSNQIVNVFDILRLSAHIGYICT